MSILPLLLLLWLLPTLIFLSIATVAIPGTLARQWMRRPALIPTAGEDRAGMSQGAR